MVPPGKLQPPGVSDRLAVISWERYQPPLAETEQFPENSLMYVTILYLYYRLGLSKLCKMLCLAKDRHLPLQK